MASALIFERVNGSANALKTPMAMKSASNAQLFQQFLVEGDFRTHADQHEPTRFGHGDELATAGHEVVLGIAAVEVGVCFLAGLAEFRDGPAQFVHLGPADFEAIDVNEEGLDVFILAA